MSSYTISAYAYQIVCDSPFIHPYNMTQIKANKRNHPDRVFSKTNKSNHTKNHRQHSSGSGRVTTTCGTSHHNTRLSSRSLGPGWLGMSNRDNHLCSGSRGDSSLGDERVASRRERVRGRGRGGGTPGGPRAVRTVGRTSGRGMEGGGLFVFVCVWLVSVSIYLTWLWCGYRL